MDHNEIVHKGMYANDAFSKWLGISLIDIGLGTCTIKMTVRHEMTNGFGMAHGGVTYAFADSSLAFASNSRGQHAVSIETSISHLKPVNVGDILTAVATEVSRSRKLGLYHITIKNQLNIIVADFKGTVFIKDTFW